MSADVAVIRAHLGVVEGTWDDPDRALLDGGMSPAPELPLDLMRSWGAWLTDYAAMKSAPVGYAFGALLAAAGASIGAARKVRARPGWEAFPALWVLSIGPPSAAKSPVLTPILEILKSLERDERVCFDPIRRTFETNRQAAKECRERWEGEVKAAVKGGRPAPEKPASADEPEEPSPPRIVVGDPTIEAMAPVLKHNPRGVILARDELAGFVGNFGKYGGDGDAAFYLERYDGSGFTVDRIKRGHVEAPTGLVSIIGGIQPERLAEVLFERPDDGFVSRFLLIYPAPVPRIWQTPVADMDRLKGTLRRLRGLPVESDNGQLTPRIVPLSSGASELFAGWWADNGTDGEASAGFQAGLLGKAPGVVLRLALILEYLEWALERGPEPAEVSRPSLAAATGLFEEYLAPSAARVFGGATGDKNELRAAMLAKQIRRRGERSINARAIRRGWRLPGLSSARAVGSALECLETAGWVRKTAPQGVGRPAGDWEVNPLLWDES
jgi:hypothetical protein